jgi:hypothetical protein
LAAGFFAGDGFFLPNSENTKGGLSVRMDDGRTSGPFYHSCAIERNAAPMPR